MLFTRLQGHAESLPAALVYRHADDAPGYRSFVVVLCCEIGSMGSAIAHGDAKALRSSNHNIGAHLPRWGQQSKAQDICRRNSDGAVLV